MLAMHVGILPLDRQRPFIPHTVEGPDDAVEIDVATPHAPEVPTSTMITERQVGTEHTRDAVVIDRHILHVRVHDSVAEHIDELDRIDTLPEEVAGVEVEAERLVVPDGLQRRLCAVDVVGDLGWMHFQRELHADFAEDIEDGTPPSSKVLEALLDAIGARRRKEIPVRPDRAAGETIDDTHAEFRGRTSSVLDLLRGSFAHAFGVSMPPDMLRQNLMMAFIDPIADRLAHEVGRDRPALEPVFGQQVMSTLTVPVLLDRAGHLEVISPAGQFQTVVAQPGGDRGHFGESEIGPLAGEERDWSMHGDASFAGGILPRSEPLDRRPALLDDGAVTQTPLVLGIDIGTSGCRVLAVQPATGAVVDQESGSWTTDSPHPHWSEQDPDVWWDTTASTIRRLINRLPSPDVVHAVAFAGQMHGLVLHDESGQVLRPAILWNDQRTVEQCQQIHELLGRETLIQHTGKPALPGFTAPKLRWIQQHEPDVADRIARICLPKDHVRFRATGIHAIDAADASGTSWLDLETRDWSPTICESLDVDPNWLPTVHEAADIIGAIDADGARATGLPEGTPVVAGAGDQAAAGIACGVVREGLVSVTIGTSGVVFAQMDHPSADPSGALHGFCHAVSGRWHVMGCMLAAGGSLQWWRDAMGIHADFDALIEEIADIPPGADGVRFLPYLSGERSPHDDPRASGAFLGLTMQHDRRHMTRAVLEGIAMGLNDMLELLRAGGHDTTTVRVAGGATRNPFWLQLLADVFQVPVETVNVPDATAYGAAMLAAVGSGTHADAIAAADAMVSVTTRVEPDGDDYAELRATWGSLYQALAPTMHRLADQSTIR